MLRFRSRDVGSVEETWQRFVPSARLQRAEPHRFTFDWASVDLPGLTVVRYELAAGVRSVVDPEGQILACMVRGAGAHVETATGDPLDGAPWITDGPAVQARWDGAAVVQALIFERGDAERLARQISGDDALSLRVREPRPIGADAGRHWQATFEHVLSALMAPGADDGILRSSLHRHALMTTLSAFHTTFRDTMERSPQTRAAPALVRRALDHIDENAANPITVDDVAAAVHISTRGLQIAFRRALGITPGEALRRARLAGAHRDLRAGGETVAAVARRWGFSHPSRFAAYYREQYGVHPGATTRR